MRILQVISALDAATGGPPIVATRLAAALARQEGIEQVTLAAYDWPGRSDAVHGTLSGVPGIDRVRIVTTPSGGPRERLFAAGVRRCLDPIVRQHNLVHLHGVWDRILLEAARLARAAGVPHVVTPHGMLDPWSLEQSRWKKRIALAMGYRALLNRAAFIHWLNRDEAALARPLGLSPPGVVIGNGIFPEEYSNLPQRGAFRSRHAAIGDAPYALFMARLHHKKGLDVLAEAMRRAAALRPDLHLVVAGPDDGARDDFQRRVTEAGLSARVHLVGPLYGRDKLAALVDAAMFVLPSRQEGFSIAITEAMACALPVVVSDACHFPEVAEEKCGHVVPLDAGATADRMVVLLNGPVEAAAMGQRGRALVLDRFTWPQVARQMSDAYRRTLRGKG